jgi:hypothetical protein
MVSCCGRDRVKAQTLANLAKTDLSGVPIHVQTFEANGKHFINTQTKCVYEALRGTLDRSSDYILLLADNLELNRHIRYNLANWRPYADGELMIASLYNPSVRELAYDLPINARWVKPGQSFAGQGLLLSRRAVEHIVRQWHRSEGSHEFRISRLARQLGKLVLYHAPSLVQCIDRELENGSGCDEAMDFDPNWRAVPLPAQDISKRRWLTGPLRTGIAEGCRPQL